MKEASSKQGLGGQAQLNRLNMKMQETAIKAKEKHKQTEGSEYQVL